MRNGVDAASQTFVIATAPNEAAMAARRSKLVAKYVGFRKRTAENFIKLCETVYTAKEELSPEQFSQFCKEVGLDERGATCRKFLKVGSEASRFEPFIDNLPANWTTLYDLAKMEKDQFDRIANDNQINSAMTAADIDRCVSRERDAPTRKRNVIIDLSSLDEDHKTEVFRALQRLQEQFGFDLKVPDDIATLVEPDGAGGSE